MKEAVGQSFLNTNDVHSEKHHDKDQDHHLAHPYPAYTLIRRVIDIISLFGGENLQVMIN